MLLLAKKKLINYSKKIYRQKLFLKHITLYDFYKEVYKDFKGILS